MKRMNNCMRWDRYDIQLLCQGKLSQEQEVLLSQHIDCCFDCLMQFIEISDAVSIEDHFPEFADKIISLPVHDC